MCVTMTKDKTKVNKNIFQTQIFFFFFFFFFSFFFFFFFVEPVGGCIRRALCNGLLTSRIACAFIKRCFVLSCF